MKIAIELKCINVNLKLIMIFKRFILFTLILAALTIIDLLIF